MSTGDLLVRYKDGWNYLRGNGDDGFSRLFEQRQHSTHALRHCKNGQRVVVLNGSKIQVLDLETRNVLQTLTHERCAIASLSPRGNFVTSWHRVKKVDGVTGDNLIVWSVATGEAIAKFSQKDLNKEQWPTVRWSDDESIAARTVTNQVHIYAGGDIGGGIVHYLRRPGVTHFSIEPHSTASDFTIVTFSPEHKGQPATAELWRSDSLTKPAWKQRIGFGAETATFNWAPNGSAVLICSEAEHDTTGQSYYGSKQLHLLIAHHGSETDSCKVPVATEGFMEDAQWNPNSKEFILIDDYPKKATLFDARSCSATFSFGQCKRNVVKWSPHGRFVVLGGFGNLAGEMDFWDMNKKKKIGSCQDRDGAKSFSWSPDSRMFVTASLRPWRRVDNGFKVWRYNGELIVHEKTEELWQAEWRPIPHTNYADRPMSPKRVRAQKEAIKTGGTKKSGYVPPHLRGRSVTGSLHEKLKQPAIGAGKVRAVHTGISGKVRAARGIPGIGAPPGAQAAEDAKTAAKAAAAKRKRERRKANRQNADEEVVAESKPAQTPASELPTTSEECAKQLKKLTKTMRQITSLKERLSNGQILQDSQTAKVAKESEFQAMILQLEAMKF